jgi:hypothetical protein
VVIRKNAYVEEDLLEIDVRPASSGVDATDRHEALQGHSVR